MKNMTGAGALKMARGVKTSQTCSPAQLKLKLFSNLPSYTCCFNFVHSLFSNLENRAIRRDIVTGLVAKKASRVTEYAAPATV